MRAVLVVATFVVSTVALPSMDYFKTEPRRKLSEYLQHYEVLDYDADAVHKRLRRSTHSLQDLHITFRALGRIFKLRLNRDTSDFSDDLIVEDSQGRLLDVDTSHIFHGDLTDDPNSKVFGSVIEGVFEGKIVLQNESFYVEHARRYFPDDALSEVHSVIYKEGDVADPYKTQRHDGHHGHCGLTDKVSNWMENIQNTAANEEPDDSTTPTKEYVPDSALIYSKRLRAESSRHFQSKRHSISANKHSQSHSRLRRATSATGYNSCSLYIRTDPILWRHIREGVVDRRVESTVSTRSGDNMKARREIISLIAHHVAAINYIYGRTKFNGRYEHRNINFVVQRIKIYDYSICNPENGVASAQYCADDLSAENLLKLHTLENNDDFCLAYLFTYRDFGNSVLGLSFLAKTTGAFGGICEKYKTYTEKIGSSYQNTKRSLNTGIITFVNHNSTLPPLLSQLNFAHQIGHNFGSPNDYPLECQPGGQQGNFLMFGGATSGDKPNNSRFSPCSIGNISQVLDLIHDGRRRNCNVVSDGSFCGNKIVEPGEECDCGYDDEECTDRCCYPRAVSEYDKERNVTAKGCSRKINTQCSPSQGPCCDELRCNFYSAEMKKTCREATECSEGSYCSGYSAECPVPKALLDRTKCNNGTQMCISGECRASMCLAWNITQCFLPSTPSTDTRILCQLACQNEHGICQSTADFAHEVDLPAGGMSLQPGSPCNNYQCYCDIFLKCRAVPKKL